MASLRLAEADSTRTEAVGRALSTATHGYTEALEKLSSLQSNQATTQLFDGGSSSSSSAARGLNAAAMPEMQAWLRRAGYERRDLARMRHIHVAGTNGKGSVCANATAMLRRHGARVGTFTSPHLVSPRERIAVNGEPLGQQAFADAALDLWERFSRAAHAEGVSAAQADGPASKPFFFRFLAILAWHVFLARGVDSVVVECGIGGEYDATNVLPPEAVSAAVIAQLGVDHVAMLGASVEDIAWHKAGILKPSVRAFTRRLDAQPAVMDVLRQRAADRRASLVEVDDAAVERWGGVEGSLGGDFQKRNQALAALAVREHLGLNRGSIIPYAALRDLPDELAQGLRDARIRGRCEMVEQPDLTWLLDGAHTTESLDQVAAWLARLLRADETAVLLFNQQDRDAVQLLAHLVAAVGRETGRGGVFHGALFTRNDQAPPAGGAAADTSMQDQAAAAMAVLAPGCEMRVLSNVDDAVAEARRMAGPPAHGTKPKVLVTGSLHLVGGVLRALEPDSPL